MKDFDLDAFDPHELDPEQTQHAMGEMVNHIRGHLEEAFPANGSHKAAGIMAGVMLILAAKYAGESGVDPVEWLEVQVKINRDFQDKMAMAANAQNN